MRAHELRRFAMSRYERAASHGRMVERWSDGGLRRVALATAVALWLMTAIASAEAASGTTTKASVSSAGVSGDSHSFSLSISADGRYVAFASLASNPDRR
jgi:hypothetical protein